MGEFRPGETEIIYYPDGNIKYRYEKNSEFYFDENGDHHRDDGPDYTCWDDEGNIRAQSFEVHGQLHREDGPAWIFIFKSELESEYFLYGEKYTDKEIIDNWQEFSRTMKQLRIFA